MLAGFNWVSKILTKGMKLQLTLESLDYASTSFQFHLIRHRCREQELIWVIADVSERWAVGAGVCESVCGWGWGA